MLLDFPVKPGNDNVGLERQQKEPRPKARLDFTRFVTDAYATERN